MKRQLETESRVNMQDNANSVQDELVTFESKIHGKSRWANPNSKYPNIELKRCFEAKNFRESNREITRLATTRAGTMRTHVLTSQPRNKRMTAPDDSMGRSLTRKD